MKTDMKKKLNNLREQAIGRIDYFISKRPFSFLILVVSLVAFFIFLSFTVKGSIMMFTVWTNEKISAVNVFFTDDVKDILEQIIKSDIIVGIHNITINNTEYMNHIIASDSENTFINIWYIPIRNATFYNSKNNIFSVHNYSAKLGFIFSLEYYRIDYISNTSNSLKLSNNINKIEIFTYPIRSVFLITILLPFFITGLIALYMSKTFSNYRLSYYTIKTLKKYNNIYSLLNSLLAISLIFSGIGFLAYYLPLILVGILSSTLSILFMSFPIVIPLLFDLIAFFKRYRKEIQKIYREIVIGLIFLLGIVFIILNSLQTIFATYACYLIIVGIVVLFVFILLLILWPLDPEFRITILIFSIIIAIFVFFFGYFIYTLYISIPLLNTVLLHYPIQSIIIISIEFVSSILGSYGRISIANDYSDLISRRLVLLIYVLFVVWLIVIVRDFSIYIFSMISLTSSINLNEFNIFSYPFLAVLSIIIFWSVMTGVDDLFLNDKVYCHKVRIILRNSLIGFLIIASIVLMILSSFVDFLINTVVFIFVFLLFDIMLFLYLIIVIFSSINIKCYYEYVDFLNNIGINRIA